MRVLLDLFYLLGLLLAFPWVVSRLARSGGLEHMPARLGIGIGPAVEDTIWLHGSSAGEVSLLRPLVARLERDSPETRLIISTYTVTGLEAARKSYPHHRVILFPLDLSLVVRRFLRRFDPQLVVIVESEFWPNFLLAAQRRGIPVAVLNGKMSEKSYRAYRRTGIVPHVLRTVRLMAVQSAEHAERMRRLGVPHERIHVTGNMKYDLARAAADDAERGALRERLGYSLQDIVVIGGSLHPGEDKALLDAFAALPPASGAALIIVPRYPSDAPGVAQRVEASGVRAVLKTRVDRGDAPSPGADGVLVVDTVGELGRLYGAADIAFVGGSLFYRGSNKGGHNLMEPAILGVPVVFGPYNFSFKETVEDLLAADAAVLVRDAAELAQALVSLVADERRRRSLGQRGRQVMLHGQGATQRNYALLSRVLEGARTRLQAQAFERTMPRASGHLDSR